MNPVPKDQTESEKAIQEFLDKGGKIQKFAYGERTETLEFKHSFYGKKKKKQDDGDE